MKEFWNREHMRKRNPKMVGKSNELLNYDLRISTVRN
jgi:hypothetical protein